MLFKGPNGRICSTLSGSEILAQSNTDDFIENTKIVAEKTGSMDLWREMFGDDDGIGQDSAFMDDNFGG
ncbi:hypothetical protein Syn7803C53_52 [Synechococcus phage ACG-2014a]|uniref:Uncharacterized protein n=1 Tax=Synechococcus phage ACG-2014a TaxID=1493507 RepID=A0A0E3ESJ5_9CAUD|nr:hypothetical protein Syn7803C53_52 [Synechococcus phage ACG-2014a]AIX36689.1 hypothetical protein Syn7803US79_53 [Synechococcus phage ACG-2014a]